jgi:PTH1 family peptidyl-tRNA hydrolase
VLRPFGSEERKELPLLLEQTADAIESLVVAGLERSQNIYNSIDGKAT